MGEGVSSSPQKTLEELFNEAVPYFMAIGMSYDDFWHNSPELAKTFLKMHEIKQKQEQERLWLQGYYTYIALCSVSPVLHAFAKKGTKPLPYPKKPLASTKEEVEDNAQQARNQRLLKLKDTLMSMSKRR